MAYQFCFLNFQYSLLPLYFKVLILIYLYIPKIATSRSDLKVCSADLCVLLCDHKPNSRADNEVCWRGPADAACFSTNFYFAFLTLILLIVDAVLS